MSQTKSIKTLRRKVKKISEKANSRRLEREGGLQLSEKEMCILFQGLGEVTECV